jgi:hypothetical protein
MAGVLHHLLHRGGSFGRRAFEVFHHQIVWAVVVKRADVGMIERGYGAGFAIESLTESCGGSFDGDRAVEPRVADLPHFAHPSNGIPVNQFSLADREAPNSCMTARPNLADSRGGRSPVLGDDQPGENSPRRYTGQTGYAVRLCGLTILLPIR